MYTKRLNIKNKNSTEIRIAVVIPSYKVTRHIIDVIRLIPDDIWRIYIVDDACPEGSGSFVKKNSTDTRVKVIFHTQNQGVGGAVMSGYKKAIDEGADLIVKIDGDGQMDPSLIFDFIEPLMVGEADYTKGNRFFDLEHLGTMPGLRLVGNSILSLMTKLSSGYWNIFDPTNGYTAIHADVAKRLPFNKISKRYFFESDMLFRLNTIRAVVVDVPMDAKYGNEISNLKIKKILPEFIFKHTRNFYKRIFYNYYLRDLSLASIELPIGVLMFLFGVTYGAYHWYFSIQMSVPTPAGTVMLAALPIMMGLQLILSFLGYDVGSVPKKTIHRTYYTLDK